MVALVALVALVELHFGFSFASEPERTGGCLRPCARIRVVVCVCVCVPTKWR